MDTPIPYNRPLVVAALSRTVARWLLPLYPGNVDAWMPNDHEASMARGIAHGLALVEQQHGEAALDPRIAVELVAWAWVLGRLGGLIERPGGWERAVSGSRAAPR